MKQIIYTKHAPEPIGPYSQAVLVGDTLYVSGQIPVDSRTNRVVNDAVADQTQCVLDNISAILEAADFVKEEVVKCSIFVTDMGSFNVVNEVYNKFFSSLPPARETVEVSRLPKDVKVEISCIAVK